jgi:hypothetical protein
VKAPGLLTNATRHLFAAAPIILGVIVAGAGVIYFLHDAMPGLARRNLPIPEALARESWGLLGCAAAFGALGAAGAVWASLRKGIAGIAAAAVVVMLGLHFEGTHFFSRHARDGDGEKMLAFARTARAEIGGDGFAVFKMEKLCAEPYVGRFGQRIRSRWDDPNRNDDARDGTWLLEDGNSSVRWLMTCDRGLIELGAAGRDEQGDFTVPIDGKATRFRTLPWELGAVRHVGGSVRSQKWGRMYLIELGPRPIRLSGTPTCTGFIPGVPENAGS